jgi:hypothetical protein
MAEAQLHAGLIVIVPNVRPIAQSKLFERALREIAQIPAIRPKFLARSGLFSARSHD